MKKKSCMLLLSLSLVLSNLTPVMAYAEENEILTEESLEMNSNDSETTAPESAEEDAAISIDSIQQVELDTPVTMEEQAAVQELADTEGVEWHNLEEYNLRYRYKDNVLRVELLDESQPQKATKFGSTGTWTSGEAKTITKIEIGEGIVTIDANWFNGSSTPSYKEVKEVVLPSTVKKIDGSAFNGDSALQNINLENIEEIGAAAFQSNSSLLQLRLDSVKKIGTAAFNGCSSLQYLTLGEADVSIAKRAFMSCKLSAVCYGGTKDKWQAICTIERSALKNAQAVHCKAEEKPKAATCLEAGDKTSVCGICKEAYKDDNGTENPALGHDYVSTVTKEATCTEDGVQTDTCTRCGDVKTQTIKATGHQWSDWTKTADATVSGAEQQQRTCTVCGTVETKDVGEKLAPTATVNASTVTLKAKQSTKGLKVTGLAKGDSVATWKSTNTKVFTVKGNADGTCILTGKKKGSAKLEITLASGLTKTVTVKVQKTAVKTSKVKVAEKKLTVKKGEKASLKATVAPFTSAQKLTYTSSNKKVATVSKNGVVTAKKAGTAKITVKSGSKKVTVTITVPKTKTSSITVAKDITVKKGKTYRLKAKVAPKNSDEKITYTSSNKKIATVTKSGKVKGIKKGTATITVKSGSETVKVNVTVK